MRPAAAPDRPVHHGGLRSGRPRWASRSSLATSTAQDPGTTRIAGHPRAHRVT